MLMNIVPLVQFSELKIFLETLINCMIFVEKCKIFSINFVERNFLNIFIV